MELRIILEMLWRRRWLLLKIFGAVFLTIVIGSLMITPSYDSTAKVLLRKSSASATALASIGVSGGTGQSSSSLSETDRADYLALVAMRPVAERVISELNVKRLRTRARLMNIIPFLKPILRLVGINVAATEQPITAEELLDPGLLNMIFPKPSVSIDQYEETDIIEIEANSPYPEQAKEMANSMAIIFIDEELKRVREDYTGVKMFIDQHIVKARLEYAEALSAVKDFKEREKSIDLTKEVSDAIQKISDLKKTFEDNNLLIYKTKASINNLEFQIKSIPKLQKSSELFNKNDMILTLKGKLQDIYLALAETKTKYTKDNPNVIDMENKIKEAKKLLRKEAEKIFGSETFSIDPIYQDVADKLAIYYADLAGYESQNQAIPAAIKRNEDELLKLPKQVSDYAPLELAETVTKDIYTSLLKYQYQMGMAESMALSSVYLVESAIAAKPNDSKHKSPSLLLNMIIAVMMGAVLGIGMALLVEYIDDTIKTTEDIKAFKSLTFLGSIQKLKKKEHKLINMLDPRATLREFIRTIRSSIKYTTLDKTLKSIAVTSSLAQEGKSFFAANLAISVASEGKKVLIIDSDLRRPGITSYFDLPKGPGLTNYLIGDAELKDIQIKTGVEGLCVITTGPIPPDPGRLIESNKLHNLINDMEMIYDFVIVDTPPVLAASDAIVLGGWTDGCILVIESGRAERRHITDIIELCKRANINLIGGVLNKVHSRAAAYYYYYY